MVKEKGKLWGDNRIEEWDDDRVVKIAQDIAIKSGLIASPTVN